MKYFYFLVLASFSGFGQISGVVIDETTLKPVPFATIWMPDANSGTTTNQDGSFTIASSDTQVLTVSAVGYETKNTTSDSASSIQLKPVIYRLNEVVINQPKFEVKQKTGTFRLKDISLTYGGFEKPWRMARYVDPSEVPEKTSFLSTVTLATICKRNPARFNLHIIEAKPDGTPGDEIVTSNIIVTAKKGKNKTVIDVSKFHIRCPEDGFFIAVEWLILPENKYVHMDKLPDGTVSERISYMPWIGTQYSSINNSWGYNDHDSEWALFKKNKEQYDAYDKQIKDLYESDPKKYEDIYLQSRKNRTEWEQFAMELTFTN